MIKNVIIIGQFFVIMGLLVLVVALILFMPVSQAVSDFGLAMGFVDKVYTNTHDGMKRIQERNEKYFQEQRALRERLREEQKIIVDKPE